MDKKDTTRLRSANIHWDPKDQRIVDIMNGGEIKLDYMDKDDVKYLITELDRRLVQLWDKVIFERKQDV